MSEQPIDSADARWAPLGAASQLQTVLLEVPWLDFGQSLEFVRNARRELLTSSQPRTALSAGSWYSLRWDAGDKGHAELSTIRKLEETAQDALERHSRTCRRILDQWPSVQGRPMFRRQGRPEAGT